MPTEKEWKEIKKDYERRIGNQISTYGININEQLEKKIKDNTNPHKVAQKKIIKLIIRTLMIICGIIFLVPCLIQTILVIGQSLRY